MKLINIHKTYYNKHSTKEALKGINLELNEKGLIVLLGSSGCGKTTLLNIISGQDKDFTGELIDVPQLDYLTQNFNLMESMTIYENLQMVKDDASLIEEKLKQFDLWQHKDKKVKHCSNGQKKRIQFIRALMHQPGLLLCDEPTAALDHEGAVLLMECLKGISSEVQMIIVTHNITLAKQYAQRIITMDQGIIVSDETLVQNDLVELGYDIQKKTFKDTCLLVMREIKSRALENSLFVTLSFLCMMAIFVTFNLYATIENQTDYKNAFKYSENMILSYPKDTTLILDDIILGDRIEHMNYDLYTYQDIQKILEEVPEIMAVEAFFDLDIYCRGPKSHAWRRERDRKAFINYQPSNPESCSCQVPELQTPIYILQKYNEKFDEVDRLLNEDLSWRDLSDRTQIKPRPGQDIISDLVDEGYIYNDLAVFNLVSDTKLPVLYGNYPQGMNEVLLPLDTAEFIIEKEGWKSIEDLVGKTITIGSAGGMNHAGYLPMDEGFTLNFIERADVVVTGITPIENDYLNMVFFNGGLSQNAVMDDYVVSYEDLYYQYVRFLVNPEANIEEVLDKVKTTLPGIYSDFYLFEGFGLKADLPYYRSPKHFALFSSLIVCLFLLLIAVSYIFISKRKRKEKKLLKQYGYQIILETMMRLLVVNGVGLFIMLNISRFLCSAINQFASNYQFERFMTYKISQVILSGFSVFVFMFVIELLIGVRLDD